MSVQIAPKRGRYSFGRFDAAREDGLNITARGGPIAHAVGGANGNASTLPLEDGLTYSDLALLAFWAFLLLKIPGQALPHVLNLNLYTGAH
jgi:hypothetical protein